MRPVGVWLTVVGSVLVVAAVAVACWLQVSGVSWLTNVGVLTILLVVTIAYDQPGRYLVRYPFKWVFPLLGLVGAASAVRLGSIGWPHVSSMSMGGIVVTLVVLTFVAAGLREPGRLVVGDALLFPVREGQWSVGAGGVTALNHHAVRPAEAAALDLVAVRSDGGRAAGVCPSDLRRYECFGREVVSPCDGIVVAAHDDEPDQPPYRGRPSPLAPPAGNHVSIDSGTETVVLSHLRQSSVLVSVGAAVRAGQALAAVGNSGHSSEPHLHVHAERDGHAVRLRFRNLPRGRLRPGVLLRVDEDSREVASDAPEQPV